MSCLLTAKGGYTQALGNISRVKYQGGSFG